MYSIFIIIYHIIAEIKLKSHQDSGKNIDFSKSQCIYKVLKQILIFLMLMCLSGVSWVAYFQHRSILFEKKMRTRYQEQNCWMWSRILCISCKISKCIFLLDFNAFCTFLWGFSLFCMFHYDLSYMYLIYVPSCAWYIEHHYGFFYSFVYILEIMVEDKKITVDDW